MQLRHWWAINHLLLGLGSKGSSKRPYWCLVKDFSGDKRPETRKLTNLSAYCVKFKTLPPSLFYRKGLAIFSGHIYHGFRLHLWLPWGCNRTVCRQVVQWAGENEWWGMRWENAMTQCNSKKTRRRHVVLNFCTVTWQDHKVFKYEIKHYLGFV